MSGCPVKCRSQGHLPRYRGERNHEPEAHGQQHVGGEGDRMGGPDRRGSGTPLGQVSERIEYWIGQGQTQYDAPVEAAFMRCGKQINPRHRIPWSRITECGADPAA